MTTITAKTILSSQLAQRPETRLDTLLLRYPRWIHAEQKTHRQIALGEDFEISMVTPALMECADLSRNAGSSRAIPLEKMIADILADPAEPLWWGKNQQGMQAYEELSPEEIAEAKVIWNQSMHEQIANARKLFALGLHKQVVNRILEAYSHITVLVSATEWSNYMALRDHPAAEPHIKILAGEIKKCLAEPPMQVLTPGEWHTPFITKSDIKDAQTDYGGHPAQWEALRRLSSARCASTSYKTVDGFDMTMERAEKVYDNLVKSDVLHASPFEHVAQADNGGWRYGDGREDGDEWVWGHPADHRNFRGFRQMRAMIEGSAIL